MIPARIADETLKLRVEYRFTPMQGAKAQGNSGLGIRTGPYQSELADVTTRPAGVPAPKDKPRGGYVALQSHNRRIDFRKVQIRDRDRS